MGRCTGDSAHRQSQREVHEEPLGPDGGAQVWRRQHQAAPWRAGLVASQEGGEVGTGG